MSDYRSMFDRAYLGAWDLPKGQGAIVTIEKVQAEELRNASSRAKKPVIYFVGKRLGFALNKTNAKAIAAMYGNDTSGWLGKRITIFATKTSFGGEQVDAIRVKPGIPRGKSTGDISEGDVDEAMRGAQERARTKALGPKRDAVVEAELVDEDEEHARELARQEEEQRHGEF